MSLRSLKILFGFDLFVLGFVILFLTLFSIRHDVLGIVLEGLLLSYMVYLTIRDYKRIQVAKHG